MPTRPDDAGCLVSYDYKCESCGEKDSRTIRRKEKDRQACTKGHWMTRQFPASKKWGTGYPKVIWTLSGDPVATSPRHYARMLKERGLVVTGGAKRGWT